MNSRRTVILLVAIVVGAIASFGLLTYVRGLEGEASKGMDMTEVWVVTAPIPRGTPGEAAISNSFIALRQIPVEFEPATAVIDPNNELANHVAATDIPANTPLVSGMFVPPNAITTSIVDRLEEKGLVSFTFSVDQIRGVGGMIQPGDYVNVISVPDVPRGTSTGQSVELAEGEAPSSDVVANPYVYDIRYVFQKVEVLAVGQQLPADLGATPSSEDEAAAAGSSGLITVAVPPEAIQVLAGADMSRIYLSLVPKDYEPRPLPRLNPGDNLPGEIEGQLTPYWAIEDEQAQGAE